MIYDIPTLDDTLQQGDIFIGLPRVDISLKQVVIASESGQRVAHWVDLADGVEPISAIVPMRPVACIVATQDCDAKRSRDITLCEIREFQTVEGKCRETRKPKSWKNIITQQARINLKWFYLPPDAGIGFDTKMAVDFLVTMRVPRQDLEDVRKLRKCRLNPIAREHFRERISEFFRRYPYDEWYPLDAKEFAAYSKEYPDAPPFSWQNNQGRDTQ